MSHLALSLLGAFQATLDGDPVTFRSTKARALLAYLAVESERPHRREILAALLWPEEPERVAYNNFRQTLSSLRKAIGDRERIENPVLFVTRETVQFNCASDCWLDVHAFQQHLADANPGSIPSQLAEAVTLYRGGFLEGFYVKDSAAFEDWTLMVRDRLQRQAATVLQRLVESYEGQGDYGHACTYAWRWVELEPWQEDAYRHMMRVLALSEQRTAALAQYEVCCAVLQEEFGVEPSDQTIQLYELIRDGDLTVSLPSEQAVRAIIPFSSPEMETMAFVAREGELVQLEAQLRLALSGRGRTVFVTGEAGQGKTMLIQAFAERARAAWPQL
ncbi:MAG: AAA family ATPase, partial [Anaerolineae bacterium]|nr:AAA family ATPase [Anaerolineae bacterium]